MKDHHQSLLVRSFKFMQINLLIIVVNCVGLQQIGEENMIVVIGCRVRTFCIKSISNRKFN